MVDYSSLSILPDKSNGLLSKIRRRKAVVVGSFVLVASMFAGLFYLLPVSFSAEAQVVVAGNERVVAGAGDAPSQMVGDQADIDTQMVEIGSAGLMRQVLSAPGVIPALQQECEAQATQFHLRQLWSDKPKPCSEQVADATSTVARMMAQYSVANSGHSRVISIVYRSPLATVSQLMANRLAAAYLDAGKQRELSSRDGAVSWLTSETERVRGDLSATEAKLQDFRASHGLARGQAAAISSERLSELSQQLSLALATRSAAAAALAQRVGGVSSLPSVLDSRSVSDVKQQLSDVNAELAQQQARYGSAYPAVVALQQRRDSLRGELGSEVGRVSQSLQHSYDAAARQVTDLTAQLNQSQQHVGVADQAEGTASGLQRELAVEQELYLDTVKKLNALQTDRRVLTGNAELVSYAELPLAPTFPRKLPFVIVGLLLAAGAGIAGGLLKDMSDSTVRASGSLRQLTGIPVLALVPRLRGKSTPNLVNQPSALQEAIRALYARCQLAGVHNKTLLVTSSRPGDGKTFTTLAIAQFVAKTGRRVLAIEGDLRRPTFARALSVSRQTGLTDLLRGTATPDDVIFTLPTTGLDVITAGLPTVDSTDLLSGQQLVDLLTWARQNYDLVILDSPPCLSVMDARILARRTDGVLYCARWGHSELASVLEGIEDLRTSGGTMLGMIIDMVPGEQYSLYDSTSSGMMGYLPAKV